MRPRKWLCVHWCETKCGQAFGGLNSLVVFPRSCAAGHETIVIGCARSCGNIVQKVGKDPNGRKTGIEGNRWGFCDTFGRIASRHMSHLKCARQRTKMKDLSYPVQFFGLWSSTLQLLSDWLFCHLICVSGSNIERLICIFLVKLCKYCSFNLLLLVLLFFSSWKGISLVICGVELLTSREDCQKRGDLNGS